MNATPSLYHPEHDDYRQSVRTFLEREVVPAYPDWRAKRAIPRELLRFAGEHGYLGTRVPETHGGLGLDDPRFGVIVAEEAMLAGAPALALTLTLHSDVALPALLRSAPEQWREEHLPALATGTAIATVVTGEVTCDDDARLNGIAHMVVGAADADVLVVVAAGPQAKGAGPAARRITVIARDAEGVTITPSDAPIGLDAAGLATVTFEGADALVIADSADELEVDIAFGLAVTALAGARAALRVTLAYVADRRAFGQPIAAFQNTQRMLATVAAELEMADAFVERALRRRIDGSLDHAAAAAGKLFCSELYARAVDAGVQLHGGYGYIMEYEIAHHYADARFWRLTGGASQRMQDAVAVALFA